MEKFQAQLFSFLEWTKSKEIVRIMRKCVCDFCIKFWTEIYKKNSDIRPHSETFTNNTRKQCRSSWLESQHFFFIQGLYGGLGTKLPIGDIWGLCPPIIETIVMNCFLLRFWLKFQSPFFRCQTVSEIGPVLHNDLQTPLSPPPSKTADHNIYWAYVSEHLRR